MHLFYSAVPPPQTHIDQAAVKVRHQVTIACHIHFRVHVRLVSVTVIPGVEEDRADRA